MNDLSIELCHYVFEYLDLVDLSNCKLINKKFYDCVKKFEIKDLIFYAQKGCWFYLNKPFNCNHLLNNQKCLSILKHCSIPFNLNSLECLKIDSISFKQTLDLSDINKFVNLKILEIDLDNFTSSKINKLSLNNLQILKVSCSIFGLNFEICTPNLEALECNVVFSELKFTYLQSVQYLKTENYKDDILNFINLQTLDLFDTFKLDQLDISNFRKLKRLQILKDDFNQLIGLFEQKRLFRRTDLDVYLGGIRVVEEDVTNDFKFNLKAFDQTVQMANYDELIEILDWMTYIDYNQLIDSIEQLPTNFHQKYCNIQRIEVNNRIRNVNQLIQFISNCSVLSVLIIKNSDLDQNSGQQLFDQLPSISSLNALVINENYDINFDFIFKMFNLKCLKTNQQIQINTISDLDKFKHPEEINFEIDGQRIKIQKSKPKSYRLECGDLVLANLEITRLIEWLMKLNRRILIDKSKKYFDFKTLIINFKVNNSNELIQLIKKCKLLRYLTIENTGLDQKFFNLLPTICSLKELTIEEAYEVDLNFVFKMFCLKYLTYSTPNQLLSIDFITKLDKLIYLKKVNFKINRKLIKIKRTKDGKYRLENDSKLIRENMTINDLIKLCNKLNEESSKIDLSLFANLKKCTWLFKGRKSDSVRRT